MHVSTGSECSETRGSKLLPAMIFAGAVVMVAIMGVVFDRQWWFIGVALAVELAVVFAGVRLVMPVLSDGEVADAHDAADGHETFASLAARMVGVDAHQGEGHPHGHTPDLPPHIAARLRGRGSEFAQTHIEEPALGSVAGE